MSNIQRSHSGRQLTQTARPSDNWSNSIGVRFTIALLLMSIVPALTVGWLAYNLAFENIRSERIRTVGNVADTKHEQLVRVLTRANDRAKSFLLNLKAQCNAVKFNQGCANKLIESYIGSEDAQGLTLYLKDGKRLSLGTPIVTAADTTKFQPGQLAKLSGTGKGNNTSYFIAVAEPDTGIRLEVTYPSTNFQSVFDRPADLGQSGETFLADGEGYFVTQARYQSTQGNDIPIHAHPMQTCLSGTNAEMLDLDYRDTKIIHGFRLVPELGSACIMAHVDQAEAFAPLRELQKKLIITISIFILLVVLVAIYLAKRIAKPVKELAETRIILEESEIKYRQLFEGSSDGILLQDASGIFIDCNEEGARLYGLTKADLIGHSPAEITPERQPDGRLSAEVAQEKFAAAMSGMSQKFELKNKRADGVIFDADVTLNRITIRGAACLHVVVSDITERKRAEQALLESEERWHFAIDGSGDGVWDWNLDTGRIVFSERYMEILGYEDNVKWNSLDDWKNQVAPEEMQQAMVMLENYLDGKVPIYSTEYRMRRADGGWAWMLARGKVVSRAEDGRPLRLIGTHTDITERKKAHEALLQSEANMCAMLDNSPYLTWLKDTEGRYIMLNKVFSDFMGLEDVRQAIGKTDLDLQPKELAEKYRADDAEVIASRRRKHVEEAAFDGKHTHWVETYKTPIINEDGKVLGTVGFAKDITARKRAEEEMRIAAVAFDTHDAIVITDASANIIRVNQAFTDVTGYTLEEVQGKNPRIMSSGRQDKSFYIEMWQQLLHTGSWAGEIYDKRKNGQIYPKWLTITAVKNERQETTHYVAIFSDISARKQAEEEIRNLAFYDSLTRLPNRRLFMDRFRAALTISVRRNDYGAVLFIDLDRFKLLNDTLGHDYGDLLLIDVAARIKSCVREMDTVARLGGDEFVVLIEGVSEDQDETSRKVGLVAEKIRDTLAQPYKLKSHEHHCSPSIGISLYRGNEKPVDDLIQQADMAMYQAKESGRNAVRFFDPLMQAKVSNRANLENDLHTAIKDGQLQLYYQVQMDSNRPTGAEALLRWIHPVRGMVLPNEFISIAEEGTLILEIGHWVLETGCGQLAKWALKPQTSELTLALNVSTKQFAQPNFVEQVAKLLEKHKINPALLKLELTESLVLNDLPGMVKKMHELRGLGVHLSMDDFGTGYSSLSYLKDLPLDQIKIDQGFVQGITDSGSNAMLVQTIIDLAKNFSLNVIAEGVETEAQLSFLKHHDCLAYQGYLFSKAVSIEEFEALLR